MAFRDDDLQIFAAEGAPPLPQADAGGVVTHQGARIWWASYGQGPVVILLHGGMGHSGNWSHQLPALAGYRAVLIDSRGHGRSTRDDRPYSYQLMAGDVVAVMDAAGIERAALVGWSDGACTALVLADQAPQRVDGVFFFACNMDPTGTREIDESNPLLGRCFGRHVADYAALSETPQGFKAMADAVHLMQSTQPNYGSDDLARIRTPVTVVQAEHDEFIRPEHASYLAETLPNAERVELAQVSHFAPVQRPASFNAAVLDFLQRVRP